MLEYGFFQIKRPTLGLCIRTYPENDPVENNLFWRKNLVYRNLRLSMYQVESLRRGVYLQLVLFVLISRFMFNNDDDQVIVNNDCKKIPDQKAQGQDSRCKR